MANDITRAPVSERVFIVFTFCSKITSDVWADGGWVKRRGRRSIVGLILAFGKARFERGIEATEKRLLRFIEFLFGFIE